MIYNSASLVRQISRCPTPRNIQPQVGRDVQHPHTAPTIHQLYDLPIFTGPIWPFISWSSLFLWCSRLSQHGFVWKEVTPKFRGSSLFSYNNCHVSAMFDRYRPWYQHSHLSQGALGNQMESVDAGTTSHRGGRARGAQSHADRALLSKPYLLRRRQRGGWICIGCWWMFHACFIDSYTVDFFESEPGRARNFGLEPPRSATPILQPKVPIHCGAWSREDCLVGQGARCSSLSRTRDGVKGQRWHHRRHWVAQMADPKWLQPILSHSRVSRPP